MVQLRVCEQCERHVRVGDDTCPFCHAMQAPQPLDLRRKIVGHLSRAQRFAAAMSMAAAPLAGCMDTQGAPSDSNTTATGGISNSGTGGSQAAGGVLATGGNQATGGIITVQPYGLPPPPTGGDVAIPVYGAPFPTGGTVAVDAGAPDADMPDADTPDSGKDAGPVNLPVYGLPPNP